MVIDLRASARRAQAQHRARLERAIREGDAEAVADAAAKLVKLGEANGAGFTFAADAASGAQEVRQEAEAEPEAIGEPEPLPAPAPRVEPPEPGTDPRYAAGEAAYRRVLVETGATVPDVLPSWATR